MLRHACLILGVAAAAATARAATPFSFDLSPSPAPSNAAAAQDVALPYLASLSPDAEPQSVYAPPAPPTPDEGVNGGGVNTEVDFRYLTDDVYRGVSHNRRSGAGQSAYNYQAQGQLSFDLGKLPHPYVGVFANVNDSDPVSRFQEVRPYAGVVYTLRPVIFDLGYETYIYPERERLTPSPNTSEIYLRITIDDSYFLLTPKPVLSPYVYGAYDYDRNKGWYIETGLKHDFDLEDFGVTLTPYADVAYISHFGEQFVVFDPHKSGFQHYDAGLVLTYSLSDLFDLPPRYGNFAIKGYLNYTGSFSNGLLADDVLWGGVGLQFTY